MPTFSSTPASRTDPAVGASVWASGSHVCSGNTGTFTANATKNPRNSQRAVATGSPLATDSRTRTSKLPAPATDATCEYRKMIETSRNAEPAIVNRKNFTAA